MQTLRSHNCSELNMNHINQNVTLMGWVHSKRDLGGLIFIDVRDHFGITQVVIHPDSPFFSEASSVRQESVIQVKGNVVKREGAINSKISTGEIEVIASHFMIESPSEILPFPVAHNPKQESEDTRLTYRFLDLRTEKMHRNILFRCNVIRYIREKMNSLGFNEFSTPILTSSSPEGARDFLVPSRLHPGHFYALPQAPQQFKQLLMCSGFDKYFQIAPCFRDEDPRADRAPGEFYQLDVEMSFATQDDVFNIIEELMIGLFENKQFSNRKILPLSHYDTKYIQNNLRKFPCIPWHDAMDKYGIDKPDLRYSLEMQNVEETLEHTQFAIFKSVIEKKGIIRAIVIPNAASQSRKFFDEADAYAKEIGLGGLPWLAVKDGEWKGSIAKQLSESEKKALGNQLKFENSDAVVFIVGNEKLKTQTAGGKIRNYFADKLNLKDPNVWAFAWIVDFPMYEFNEDDQKIDFSHNPFSMPQGGMESLKNKNPLDILAHQYDLVCNGIELSSGAIRNHRRDVMKKAFEIAGYSESDVENKFGALWNAFAFGAPPHGGIAPGIDRMVMLLLNEPNIREVIAFPLNQKAMDLLMKAPSMVSGNQLKEIHIQTKTL
ncbi:aspartate--tRNA ligase [Silvanigrella paludirubra]|uniref:Aspartate--tRNA(Asp/Asn) ligase n=1 Tax=Silvanigrella paludirubra TaxID=2499159 RepID=A0A6N6VVN7_9BACT|nr:aspartate--tRNA ligase [Silvanigrella paludirubra]KAB8039924.1 aspartate--tRNA ligase [Silvanigrella paludirubra]